MRSISVAISVAICIVGTGALVSCSSGTSLAGRGTLASNQPVHTPALRPNTSTIDAAAPGEPAAKPTADAAGSTCRLISSDVARSALGGGITDRSPTADQCLFADAGGSKRLEVIKLPASVVDAEVAAGNFAPLSGVGDKAYWASDDELLVVVKGDSAYSVNVSVDGRSEAESKSTAIAIAKAAFAS